LSKGGGRKKLATPSGMDAFHCIKQDNKKGGGGKGGEKKKLTTSDLSIRLFRFGLPLYRKEKRRKKGTLYAPLSSYDDSTHTQRCAPTNGKNGGRGERKKKGGGKKKKSPPPSFPRIDCQTTTSATAYEERGKKKGKERGVAH